MIKLKVLLLSACIIFNSFAVVVHAPPKEVHDQHVRSFTAYVGRGYNMMIGNPKSEGVLDPGFKGSVFDLTYNQGLKTSDGRFQIPDSYKVHKVTTCSFNSTAKQFTGIKSYAEDLSTYATASGGSPIFRFKFSLSTAYQKMQRQTSVNKQIIIQCQAICQCYEVLLNKFGLPKLHDDFVRGATQSYRGNNWDTFVDTYGTHYIDRAFFGGRAIQQSVFTYESVAKLQSRSIDIRAAAQASFKKFYGAASGGYSNQKQEQTYVENMRSSKNEFYIGGQPAKNGDVNEWQAKVIDNPMPISYKMSPLTDLFDHIEDPNFNKADAKNRFNTALKNLCRRNGCKVPPEDPPLPRPAFLQLGRSVGYGHPTYGKPFEWSTNSTTMDLRKVLVRSGQIINRLQLTIGDGINQVTSPNIGGTYHGSDKQWTVPNGEYVSQVEIRCGIDVDSLTFITNTGKKSPQYGQNRGEYYMLQIPEYYRIVGFFGRSSKWLHQIGFVIGKVTY